MSVIAVVLPHTSQLIGLPHLYVARFLICIPYRFKDIVALVVSAKEILVSVGRWKQFVWDNYGNNLYWILMSGFYMHLQQ